MLKILIFLLPILAQGAPAVRNDTICSLYKRQENNCAKSSNECGLCLEGFEEVPFEANATGLKPCFPKKKRVLRCDNDWDCPDIDLRFVHLCLDLQCEFCFPCEEYFRVQNSKCTKLPFECGPCAPGFHESSNITEAGITDCVPDSSYDLRKFLRISHRIKERKTRFPLSFSDLFMDLLKIFAALLLVTSMFYAPFLLLCFICHKYEEWKIAGEKRRADNQTAICKTETLEKSCQNNK